MYQFTIYLGRTFYVINSIVLILIKLYEQHDLWLWVHVNNAIYFINHWYIIYSYWLIVVLSELPLSPGHGRVIYHLRRLQELIFQATSKVMSRRLIVVFFFFWCWRHHRRFVFHLSGDCCIAVVVSSNELLHRRGCLFPPLVSRLLGCRARQWIVASPYIRRIRDCCIEI